jgi:hypothetical protein
LLRTAQAPSESACSRTSASTVALTTTTRISASNAPIRSSTSSPRAGRHAQVEDDRSRSAALDLEECFEPVGGFDHVESTTAEILDEDLAVTRLVSAMRTVLTGWPVR